MEVECPAAGPNFDIDTSARVPCSTMLPRPIRARPANRITHQGRDHGELPPGRHRRIDATARCWSISGRPGAAPASSSPRSSRRSSAAAGGKVKLVKMNIDEHPSIAGQLGIQSIPAVIAFQTRAAGGRLHGRRARGQIKEFIERLVGPVGPTPVEELLAEADAAARGGRRRRRRRALRGGARRGARERRRARRPRQDPARLGEIENAKRFLAWCRRRRPPIRRSSASAPPSSSPSRRRALGDLGGFQRRDRGRSGRSSGPLRPRARPQRPRTSATRRSTS